MDNLIIEHLACLEVNRVILQEPYRLVSEVQFNDKSPCFDGEIIVYNSNVLKKENMEDAVKVQIKGTTVFKKIKGNGRITHPIKKVDLENYKKSGKGVLYLVVTINKKNKKMQMFYNSLTPLEIERLLNVIEYNKTDSLSVDFKMVKDNELESICRVHIKNVRKQPNNFINMSKTRSFENYKVEFDILPSELQGFDPFENIAYVYGIEGDFEYPIEAIFPEVLNIKSEEVLNLYGEKINVKYSLNETKSEIIFSVEDTLEFVLSKIEKSGKLKMGRLITLEAYIKSLKVLKYIVENNRFPFEIYKINASINEKEKYQHLDEEIEQYTKLLKTCERIGINGNYIFNEQENYERLFNSIHNIFEEKNYNAINSTEETIPEKVLRLKMTDYITLLLFKDDKDGLYYNIFDYDIFKRLSAFIPKNPGEFNPNLDDYFKVSIYSKFKIEDLISLTNFNYEVYERSFRTDVHDKTLEANNELALDLISIYDKTKEVKYLNLADYLLDGLIETSTEDDIYRLNKLQIKKRNSYPLEKVEEILLYNLLEKEDDLKVKFVVNVILGLKIPAERALEQMIESDKIAVMGWPIYNLFIES